MTEATLQYEDGECHDDMDSELLSVRSLPNRSSSTKTSKKTKRGVSAKMSDLESLEQKLAGKFDTKFSALDSKLDKFFECMHFDGSVQRRPETVESDTSGVRRPSNMADNGPVEARRPLVDLNNSLNRDYGLSNPDVDTVSLQPAQEERYGLLSSHSGSEHGSLEDHDDGLAASRFDRYTASKLDAGHTSGENFGKTPNLLSELFGEDAQTKSSSDKSGIVLDKSQIEILNSTWRSSNPEKLTAYKDSYRQSFPVQESEEKYLQVPSLDDISERLLVRRHGGRAAFGSSQSLFSQPYKSIEKVAYQGQMAARMGIVSLCYGQQALSALLHNLQSNSPNMDQAVQNVRDIFAITTKSLDQMARTGAFHHLVRRKATVADTGLHEYKDLQKTALTAPLTGEGVFGKEFEQKLKDRQDKDKQLKELMPELNSRSAYAKRKISTVDSQNKRPRFAEESNRNYRPEQRSVSFKRPFGRPNTKPAAATKSSTVNNFRFPTNNSRKQ